MVSWRLATARRLLEKASKFMNFNKRRSYRKGVKEGVSRGCVYVRPTVT